ncbi:MAG: hypothetical protein V4563_17760 [Pseudomonadota bacterium]
MELQTDRGATALNNLCSMRYSLTSIQALLAEIGHDVDISHLSRVKNADRGCGPKLELALVKLHNSLCKRGEKI